MRTVEIEPGKTGLIFDSMWEYLSHFGATVEDYEDAPAEYEGDRKVGYFRPVDDVRFFLPASDDLWEEGLREVNWGEDVRCFVPTKDVGSYFWMVWEWNPRIGGYDTRGEIFHTQEAAEAKLHSHGDRVRAIWDGRKVV
jgi:hypothetical protein